MDISSTSDVQRRSVSLQMPFSVDIWFANLVSYTANSLASDLFNWVLFPIMALPNFLKSTFTLLSLSDSVVGWNRRAHSRFWCSLTEIPQRQLKFLTLWCPASNHQQDHHYWKREEHHKLLVPWIVLADVFSGGVGQLVNRSGLWLTKYI